MLREGEEGLVQSGEQQRWYEQMLEALRPGFKSHSTSSYLQNPGPNLVYTFLCGMIPCSACSAHLWDHFQDLLRVRGEWALYTVKG